MPNEVARHGRAAASGRFAAREAVKIMNPGPLLSLPVEYGNAEDIDTNETGWMIGFSDWSIEEPHNLRHMPVGTSSNAICLKWFNHAKGDPNGQDKPLSVGRTMSMLVSERSEFRLEFSVDPRFPAEGTQAHTLKRKGDFVIWGPGIYHRAYGLKSATIMTIRWEPQDKAA